MQPGETDTVPQSAVNVSAATVRVISVDDAVLNAGMHTSRITVCGTIALLDGAVKRLDVSGGGAKLVGDYSEATVKADLVLGADILVTGKLKRRQRRLYLNIESIDTVDV